MTKNGAIISTASEGRRYDIDALRVLAFCLLILYHVGMFYVADWGWHIKSAYQAVWLKIPMSFVNQWRMSLLFVISGLAVSFVWGRYSGLKLAGRRVFRLGVPLVFGMAFVVAPQPYYEALSKGVIEPGFIDFMQRYLTMQDFPGEAWIGENIATWTWTWNHLWYLPYVLLYTLLLIPIAAFLDGPGARLRQAFQALRGPWLVLVPVVPLYLYGVFVYPSFPYINHSLVGDGYAHAMYGTLFLYGYMIGRAPAFWAELKRLRTPLLMAAVMAYALFRILGMMGDDATGLVGHLEMLASYSNRWLWILTLFAWAHHALNRPLPGLRYATDAVFPWYILHQTITVVAGYELSRLALGPVVEPLLVTALTIGGCALGYELVIRRTPVLRPLFGLPMRDKLRSAAAERRGILVPEQP